MTTEPPRPPLPPFDEHTARAKVLAAENAWNTRDPHRIAAAYTPDTVWRNRSEFIVGSADVVEFLTRKWERELDYALRKELWAYTDRRIAVRFQYEWATTPINGSGHTAARTGSSTTTATCDAAKRASTTYRSTKPTAESTGPAPKATKQPCRCTEPHSPRSSTERHPWTCCCG